MKTHQRSHSFGISLTTTHNEPTEGLGSALGSWSWDSHLVEASAKDYDFPHRKTYNIWELRRDLTSSSSCWQQNGDFAEQLGEVWGIWNITSQNGWFNHIQPTLPKKIGGFYKWPFTELKFWYSADLGYPAQELYIVRKVPRKRPCPLAVVYDISQVILVVHKSSYSGKWWTLCRCPFILAQAAAWCLLWVSVSSGWGFLHFSRLKKIRASDSVIIAGGMEQHDNYIEITNKRSLSLTQTPDFQTPAKFFEPTYRSISFSGGVKKSGNKMIMVDVHTQ